MLSDADELSQAQSPRYRLWGNPCFKTRFVTTWESLQHVKKTPVVLGCSEICHPCATKSKMKDFWATKAEHFSLHLRFWKKCWIRQNFQRGFHGKFPTILKTLNYCCMQTGRRTVYRLGYFACFPHTPIINHWYWHALLDQWYRQVRTASPEIGQFPSHAPPACLLTTN